jgi:peptidoglycan/LPS O-acetylase OafA/YrhL
MQYFRIRPTRLRRALMLVVILCITLAQLPFWGWPRFGLSILYYLQYFLAGLLVADIFVVDIENMKSSWLWDLAGIASLVAIFFPPNIKYSTHALLPIPLAVLCIATMRSYSLRRVLANQWVAVIGGMCYSIYLLHFLFMATLYKATKYTLVPRAPFALNFLVQIVLTLLPAVALCVVFYWLVERPCMDPNWPSKLWHALTGRRESEVAVLDTKGI